MPADDAQHAFAALQPDQILDAIESAGQRCDGRILALNSYENRVYRIGLVDGSNLVAKFYRPGRWADDAILEEHSFSRELAELEIPVVQPLNGPGGLTLHHYGPFRLALYPCVGGRPPELDNPDHLEQMGRFLGRLHAVGAVGRFQHRPEFSTDEFGVDAHRFLLQAGFIPAELETAYQTLCEDLIERIRSAEKVAGSVRRLRLHGDFHPGNVLWTDAGPHVVDLDDARTGPAIQDIWMFLSGDRAERTVALSDMMEGYTRFCDFDPRELNLVEALRTLRMMHYAAWLARRWDDPAFPLAFPWFNTRRYWDDHILELREQAAALDEPALVWM